MNLPTRDCVHLESVTLRVSDPLCPVTCVAMSQVWSIVLSKHLQAQNQVLLPATVVGSAAGVYVLCVHPLVNSYVSSACACICVILRRRSTLLPQLTSDVQL